MMSINAPSRKRVLSSRHGLSNTFFGLKFQDNVLDLSRFLFDRASTRIENSQRNLDIASVTEESDIIMPRHAPRVELCQALTKHKFVDGLYHEKRGLETQLLKMMLFHIRANRQRRVLGVPRGFDQSQQKRSLTSEILFRYCLLQYVNNSMQQCQRLSVITTLLSERYLSVRMPLPKSFAWLHDVLPRSPDHIFSTHTRMNRRSFGMLVNLLETKALHVFKSSSSKGRPQLPVHIQLHLALFSLGYYGNGASFESGRAKFGYGVGTIQKARKRVVDALVSLASEYIRWPSPAERRALCRNVKQNYGFHSAFFLVDGTTHNFAFVPSYERNSWFDRKSNYSVQALVSCDPNLRVIHLVVGWPGSTHDSRVLGSADYMIESNEEEYFTGDQHGLGDAAFGIHKRVVPNYKEPLASVPENREYNLRHSSLRVRSEHTIGHVKGRFQGLREVRLRVSKKSHVREVVKFITAGYVLHNILLDFKDDWTIPIEELNQEADSAALREIQLAPLPELEVTETGVLFREKVKSQVLEFIQYQVP